MKKLLSLFIFIFPFCSYSLNITTIEEPVPLLYSYYIQNSLFIFIGILLFINLIKVFKKNMDFEGKVYLSKQSMKLGFLGFSMGLVLFFYHLSSQDFHELIINLANDVEVDDFNRMMIICVFQYISYLFYGSLLLFWGILQSLIIPYCIKKGKV